MSDFPETLPADALAFCEEAEPPGLDFTPVPRLRARRNGWSAERQRGFIAALARCGSVSAAARSVGMTARSAYRLLDAPGADGFARAWDASARPGVARTQIDALDRALNGAFVPVYRRGKLVRVEHRRSDRLAIALLGGRDRAIDDYRRTATSRRKYREDMAALDAERAAEAREIEEREAAYQADVDAIIERARSARPRPRVRQL